MAISSSDSNDIVADINVTPLVDVCLVLVIIFMVTAPLMTESALKVELPSAHTKEGTEQDKVTITLAADGRIALDRTEFKTIEELREDLRIRLAMSQSGLVIIRADKDALHGKLTDIMAVAKSEGARAITIATKQR